MFRTPGTTTRWATGELERKELRVERRKKDQISFVLKCKLAMRIH